MTGQHDPWFASAKEDLDFAEVGLEHEYFSQVCFLAQQSSEKALKGLLIA